MSYIQAFNDQGDPAAGHFKAAPGAARAADSADAAGLPLPLPPGWPLALVGWREKLSHGAAETRGSRQGRGRFDKGTLAAALIGLLRAGGKPARSAGERTGRRPLSNPPLRRRGSYGPAPVLCLISHGWSAHAWAVPGPGTR